MCEKQSYTMFLEVNNIPETDIISLNFPVQIKVTTDYQQEAILEHNYFVKDALTEKNIYNEKQ